MTETDQERLVRILATSLTDRIAWARALELEIEALQAGGGGGGGGGPAIGTVVASVDAIGEPGWVDPAAGDDSAGWIAAQTSPTGSDLSLGYGSDGNTTAELLAQTGLAQVYVTATGSGNAGISSAPDGSHMRIDRKAGQANPLISLRQESGAALLLEVTSSGAVDFTEQGTPPDPAANVARLYSRDNGGVTELAYRDSAGTVTALAGGGGGGAAGAPTYRAFPFAFDTADLLTGHAVYTPTVGDLLIDAWIEIDTAWDGTTPFADIGSFVGSGVTQGLFRQLVGPVPLNEADADADTGFWGQVGDGLLIGSVISSLSYSQALALGGSPSNNLGNPTSALWTITPGTGPTADPPITAANGQGAFGYGGNRNVPAKFTAATPIKVCVSQDGTNTGADPASTQGAAVLYLVTVTPV